MKVTMKNEIYAAVFVASILLLAMMSQGCDGIAGKAALKSLTITPADFIMSSGTELQFTAVARYSDKTEKEVTAEVAWDSSDTTVAAITSAGLTKVTTPVKMGTVEITASLGGISARTALSIVDSGAPPADRVNNPPRVQLMNSAGYYIYRVSIGRISFAEGLNCCDDRRFTKYFYMPDGTHSIVVYLTSTSTGVTVGTLGPFLTGKHYTIVIGAVDTVCADLLQRGQPDENFFDDSTKIHINRAGYCGRDP